MNDLIEKLMSKVGLSEEQAHNSIGALKEYVTEKFPMLEDMMDKMLGGDKDADATAHEGNSIKDKMGDALSGIADKAGDLLGGAEGALGNLADSGKDMAGEAIDKLKDMFGGKKA